MLIGEILRKIQSSMTFLSIGWKNLVIKSIIVSEKILFSKMIFVFVNEPCHVLRMSLLYAILLFSSHIAVLLHTIELSLFLWNFTWCLQFKWNWYCFYLYQFIVVGLCNKVHSFFFMAIKVWYAEFLLECGKIRRFTFLCSLYGEAKVLRFIE